MVETEAGESNIFTELTSQNNFPGRAYNNGGLYLSLSLMGPVTRHFSKSPWIKLIPYCSLWTDFRPFLTLVAFIF
jgi:hypothetical protein